MLTTLVASSKGGCGKTTLVTQLATHWAQAGKQTAIIDADRQLFAQFHPELVKGVDAPDRSLRKNVVLVQRDQAAERRRCQPRQQ